MGYTIDESLAQRTGTTCLFTRGQGSAHNRTRHSMTCQVGNAMHVNACGGVFFTVALLLTKAVTAEPADLLVTVTAVDRGQEREDDNAGNKRAVSVPFALSLKAVDSHERQLMRLVRRRHTA
eukprot:3307683-Alexandrium_andersonii.AAC.1